MPDPLKGHTLTIGKRQPMTFKFTNKALRVAQKRLGGRPVSEVLPNTIADLGMDVTCELAAAALLHENPLASDALIEALLDDHPDAYFMIQGAIRVAFWESQHRLMTVEMQAEAERMMASLGEEKAPPKDDGGASSVDGQTSQPSSGSAEGTASTPS